ncbi:RNA-binding S4 domain-containing protein [Rhodocyclaceae bacterium SMB388]
MNPQNDEQAVRIDKWLWAARLFKTRSLARDAVEAGHVRVNDTRCRPSRLARVGDRLNVVTGHATIELIVKALSGQRGPATLAQTLYEETAASVAERRRREQAGVDRARSQHDVGSRPTKRDRRRLQHLIDSG